MPYWVQECPACGACASDLSKLSPILREAVTFAVKSVPADSLPVLARRFAIWSRLATVMKRPYEAAYALIHAAWACDDDCATDAARKFRLEATSKLLLLEGEGRFDRELQAVDLLRRAQDFERALELAGKLRDEPIPSDVREVIDFQIQRSREGDVGRYSFHEAVSATTRDAYERAKQAARERAIAESVARSAVVNATVIEQAELLFATIRKFGRRCGHCHEQGGEAAYRLSIGATGSVICRRCGWPQDLDGIPA